MGARVEVYREGHVAAGGDVVPGKWRWRFFSSNGRILADSGQGYFRRIDALTGCATVLGAEYVPRSDAEQERFERAIVGADRLSYTWQPIPYTWQPIPVHDLTREARP